MAAETLVIDASVVVKWYCEEEDTDAALLIRDRFFAGKCKLTAPGLLLYEAANAIRFNGFFSEEDRAGVVRDLYSIGIEFECADEELMADAMEIALKRDTTIYDATYLALAKKLGCVYVTADSKFASRVRDKNVVTLGKYRA